MSVNKVILVGRLGADPEQRSTQSGTAVTNMRLATNRNWTDNNGQKQEDTEWHRIVVFGKTAEACGEYLEKGRQVYVEGRIQTDEWEDNDGNQRYTKEVVARNVQFLSGGSDAGPAPQQDDGCPAPSGDKDDSFDEDDIPF